MHTLNHTLEQNFLQADGRYLNVQELYPLEQYVQSYATRVETYRQISEHSEKLLMQALRELAQAYPDLFQKHGARCKYDMSEVLRYIALAILRDDEIFFKETLMAWLDTILLAYHRTTQCISAYRFLQDSVNKMLPVACSNLMRPYMELVLNTLQSHA